ncbi:MAG: NUDIX hydrolase [Nocardioidaceae bacterium]
MRIPHAALRLAVYATRRKFTAGAVVVCRSPGGQVLLVHQAHGEGRWGFPGGVVNLAESFEACAVRELFEETGIAVAEEDLELAATYTQEHAWHIDVVFRVQVPEGTEGTAEHDTFEVQDVGWFEPDRLPALRRESRELLRRLPAIVRA